MNTRWYALNRPETLDSPALVVFPDRVKQNIATAVAMAGGPGRLRPHIKTSKSADVAGLLLQAGIRKFKCATIAEADMLGQCGAPDVLLAYQPTGPKLARFVDLIRAYPATRFACLCDCRSAAAEQNAGFRAAGLHAAVFIDLDTGMSRSGIAPGDEAFQLYAFCAAADTPGLVAAGLHAYDGHLRQVDFFEKKAACDAAFAPVALLAQQLEKAGLPKPVIIAGGSPTFSVHCRRPEVECSPGTFVYWDQTYAECCPEQDFLPAAALLTRVISKPGAGRITLDLGHKSVAAENPLDRRVFFPEAPDLRPVGQSEEHLVLETSRAGEYRVGQLVYGIPYHICPTVALYERVFTAQNGQLTGVWPTTARNRQLGF